MQLMDPERLNHTSLVLEWRFHETHAGLAEFLRFGPLLFSLSQGVFLSLPGRVLEGREINSLGTAQILLFPLLCTASPERAIRISLPMRFYRVYCTECIM